MSSNRNNIPTIEYTLALFPGAFRPPHEAHLRAVYALVNRADVDEVIIIISNRARAIPGTTQALDATVAQRIWAIYLQGVPKTRIEIAPHAAVAHALSYIEHAQPGDRLLFCIGEYDYKQGDPRFKQIQMLAQSAAIRAEVFPAPTGDSTVRATDLRIAIGRGEEGYRAFITGLPPQLNATQRERVWSVCLEGARELNEIIAEKIETLFTEKKLGEIGTLVVAKSGKPEPAFFAHMTDGRRLVVKYAGDAVEAESSEMGQEPKPRRRLGTERRALRWLHANPLEKSPSQATNVKDVVLPRVVYFDKATRTLLLSEICPTGGNLQESLACGVFDRQIARSASHFLAKCHDQTREIPPLWGEAKFDVQQWIRMVTQQTVDLKRAGFTPEINQSLDQLLVLSHQARTNCLMHLDYLPKNILIDGNQNKPDQIGIIDFESSTNIGDPAYDLGLLLGHYIFWGIVTSQRSACLGALEEMLTYYQQETKCRWLSMAARVVAFAGTGILSATSASCNQHPQLLAAATYLVVQGGRPLTHAREILFNAIREP